MTGVNGNTVLDTQGFTVPINGVLSGAGGLTKAGVGQLALYTNNTFAGTMRVQAGTLRLVGNGSLASTTIVVDGGATLSATERVDGTLQLAAGQTLKGGGQVTGGMILGTGSTLAPGASAGALTASGDVTFESGATFEVELLGPLSGQYDQLLMSSAMDLTIGGATLSVSAPNLLPLNTVFAIISGFGSLDTSTFAGLPDGVTLSAGPNLLQINYGTLSGYEDDVTLTVVPEPHTLGLIAVLTAALMLRRRVQNVRPR